MRKGGTECGLFQPVRCVATLKLLLAVVAWKWSVFVKSYTATGVNIVYHKINRICFSSFNCIVCSNLLVNKHYIIV